MNKFAVIYDYRANNSFTKGEISMDIMSIEKKNYDYHVLADAVDLCKEVEGAESYVCDAMQTEAFCHKGRCIPSYIQLSRHCPFGSVVSLWYKS